jgi:hypothetical protein
MNYKVSQSWDVNICIPEDKIEEVIKDYRECINSTADIEEIYEHIAHNYCVNSSYDFIEGIGNLHESGITVEIIDQDLEIEEN